jgi:hypothetical protein
VIIPGMRTPTVPHPSSEQSAASECEMNDWWLVTLIVVAFVAAVTLLVYLGLEWAAGM